MWISDELESAIDIVDLVSKYTSLKKAGANYKCVCPFPGHNEKTPSFVVSPAKQLAYCFGCHRWGWAIKFVMDIENCEFKEAIEILGNYTWIKVNNNFNQEKFEEKKNMYSLYRDATNYYKKALENYPNVKKYLFDRWLSEEIINKFNFWYSDSWVELYNYLKKKWYEDEQIFDSKIFLDIKTKKDKFINRIIFPIQNSRWDFVAFAWRIHWEWEPKYLNSPASNFYDKSNILYNLFNARSHITKQDYIIITEWYMDVIALNKWWFYNSVAVSGTALTDKHLTLIKRLTKKIYLCFDWDSAWEKATKSSLEKMKNEWFEVKIISLPRWKDPDEIISNDWDFKKYIDSSMTPIWYYIKKSQFNTNSIDEKKKLLIELLEIVKSYSDNVEKDFYLKEIANLLNINQNIVYDSFNKIRFKSVSKKEVWDNKKVLTPSQLAIWYCLLDEKNIDIFKQKILFPESIDKDLKWVLENGKKYIESLELNKKEFYKGISLKIETEQEHSNKDHLRDEIVKMTNWLNRDIYKKEVERLKKLMASWDNNALIEYTKLLEIWKKSWIK